MENSSHEIARQIRHDFFVFRNGMLADSLRETGDTHKLIFGLNIPQIADIAKRYEKNISVATELWESSETRECRLIAPMLYPIDEFTEETAKKWISQVENIEIADNLCHKLLRYTSFSDSLNKQFENGTTLERYIIFRLAINMLAIGKHIDTEWFLQLVKNELEKDVQHNYNIARQLQFEIAELQS